MSNRTLTASLRLLSRRNGPSARLAGLPLRHFSTTPSYGVKALFTDTDDVQLNEKLQHIQNNIVLPAYLPEKQRRRVFDVARAAELEQDPIIIEVEGYEHKFTTINKFAGVENSKRIFMKVIELMRISGDWRNLGPLLAGYKKAGIKLKPDHWGTLARRAGQSDAIYSVIECAKEADKTNLRLDSAELCAKVLLYINSKVVASNWDLAETQQALRWSEIVYDLLQRPEHAAREDSHTAKLHFSKMNRSLSLLTRASVVKAKQDAGEDIQQDLVLLKDEATTLQTLWADSLTTDLATVKDFSVLNSSLERKNGGHVKGKPRALSGSTYVIAISQAMKGNELARELLGDEGAGLLPIYEALDKHLTEFVETSATPPRSWNKEYELHLGRAPVWADACVRAEAEAAEAKANARAAAEAKAAAEST